MNDVKTFIYECFVGRIDNGQKVLIQIFRDPETLEVLASQIALHSVVAGTWQTPYPLEAL